jgi:hypothetical protein
MLVSGLVALVVREETPRIRLDIMRKRDILRLDVFLGILIQSVGGIDELLCGFPEGRQPWMILWLTIVHTSKNISTRLGKWSDKRRRVNMLY